MRILAAQDRVDADEVALPVQRLQIVRHRQQVRLWRQLVRGMAPVAVGEDAELAAIHERLEALLHAGKVGLARLRPLRDGLRQGRGRAWIGLEGEGHIDPVERVEMVEVDDVVLDELRAGDQVANEPRVLGNDDAQRVLDRAHRRERMHRGADAADALGEDPGVARVASAENQLNAAKHRAGAPGVGDDAILHLDLDAQVALDTGHGINGDACHGCCSFSGAVAGALVALSALAELATESRDFLR